MAETKVQPPLLSPQLSALTSASSRSQTAITDLGQTMRQFATSLSRSSAPIACRHHFREAHIGPLLTRRRSEEAMMLQ